MSKDKEFLYVGHYVDTEGNYVLKIGTTNDLKRRAQEHTRNYRRATAHTLAKDDLFVYDWWTPLSKYNTLRYEDNNRKLWQTNDFGEYVRNDRFVFVHKPAAATIVIRKTYTVQL